MTKEELFNIITNIINSPYEDLTGKRKTAHIFVVLEEYVLDNFQDDDTENGVSYAKSKDIAFGEYAAKQLNIMDGLND